MSDTFGLQMDFQDCFRYIIKYYVSDIAIARQDARFFEGLFATDEKVAVIVRAICEAEGDVDPAVFVDNAYAWVAQDWLLEQEGDAW